MSENDEFWDFYWEMHLQGMENLGKRAAILACSRLIRKLEGETGLPVCLLELGCGEGQIIGSLVEGHARTPGIQKSIGVDYSPEMLLKARKDFPTLNFIEGNFTDIGLLTSLGGFEIVLLVNALHEVFSSSFSEELGEVDILPAKQNVELALAGAINCMAPGGWLVLFDGLEPPGDPSELIRIRFLDHEARGHFDVFRRQFHPFHIICRETGNPLIVDLSRRDFARFIDKSIFLGKGLWETERLESYQYFTESEFRDVFDRQGMRISELHTLTMNEEKWRRIIRIETPGVDFPQEHIMILAQQGGR